MYLEQAPQCQGAQEGAVLYERLLVHRLVSHRQADARLLLQHSHGQHGLLQVC